AYKYAREAIQQPYAPAFVVIADLPDNKVAKYAYLAEAVELYKNTALKFWSQFNVYCMPDISDNGLKQAQRNLAKIKLSKKELELATKEQQSLRNSCQQNAVTSK
ncbi:sel1 repeat family protein, partial [Francisella tularensis subsp. holarctica]|nr:sel1 repeat family protein [Francisella tularensis subsp. holarctica]